MIPSRNQEVYWLWHHVRRGPENADPDSVGKWMLKCNKVEHVNEEGHTALDVVWDKVKTGMSCGRVPSTVAKVSTARLNPAYQKWKHLDSKKGVVIVYSNDYTDMQQVLKLAVSLEALGLQGLGAFDSFKLDAQTTQQHTGGTRRYTGPCYEYRQPFSQDPQRSLISQAGDVLLTADAPQGPRYAAAPAAAWGLPAPRDPGAGAARAAERRAAQSAAGAAQQQQQGAPHSPPPGAAHAPLPGATHAVQQGTSHSPPLQGAGSSQPPKRPWREQQPPPRPRPSPPPAPGLAASMPGTTAGWSWSCPACTFLNPSRHPTASAACEVCGASNPLPPAATRGSLGRVQAVQAAAAQGSSLGRVQAVQAVQAAIVHGSPRRVQAVQAAAEVIDLAGSDDETGTERTGHTAPIATTVLQQQQPAQGRCAEAPPPAAPAAGRSHAPDFSAAAQPAAACRPGLRSLAAQSFLDLLGDG